MNEKQWFCQQFRKFSYFSEKRRGKVCVFVVMFVPLHPLSAKNLACRRKGKSSLKDLHKRQRSSTRSVSRFAAGHG